MMTPQRKMVYVEWLDSYANSGVWQRPEDFALDGTNGRHRSIGWVVKENKSWLLLAGHCGDSGQFSGELAIPKRSITKRKSVRRP